MSYKPQDVARLARKNLDADAVIDAVKREMFGMDNPGFCIECGEENDGCEADAEEYECACCEEHAVFGAAELLMYIA